MAEACPFDESTRGQALCSMIVESGLSAFEIKDCSSSGAQVKMQAGEKTKSSLNRILMANGVLERHGVVVLRDTGHTSVMVKRSLAPEDKLAVKSHTICLLDQLVMCLPEVKVDNSSPFHWQSNGDLHGRSTF